MLSEWNSLICKEYTIVDALDVVEITQTERAEKESGLEKENRKRNSLRTESRGQVEAKRGEVSKRQH